VLIASLKQEREIEYRINVKLIFSRSLLAGNNATGQDTSESFR